MSSNHEFEIARIGGGRVVHLIGSGNAVCGIKGDLHDASAEQAHWDCQRCDRSLADALRREALAQVQAEYAQVQAELEREDEFQADEVHIHDVMDEVNAEYAQVNADNQVREAQVALRKSLVKEYRLSKPMQRDLALSYQVALGSKDSLLEDQALLVMCHDGMTSKGLRARGLMGEGGRNGWASDEGLQIAQVMYETEDLA